MRRILPAIALLLQLGGGPGCAPPASKPISPLSADSAPPPFRVTIAAGSIRLDGETLGVTGAENRVNLDRLQARLKAGRTIQEDRRPYALAISDDVNIADVKSVIYTAAGVGWHRAYLDTGAGIVELQATVPLPPNALDPTSDVGRPDKTLVIAVRNATIEVWWRPQTSVPEAEDSTRDILPGSGLKAIGVFEPAAIARVLRKACERKDSCSPAVMLAADDTRFSIAKAALAALATSAAKQGAIRPVVQLLATNDGPSPRSKLGTPIGRVEPLMVRSVIRGQYDRMRHCYEEGLKRDQQLHGTVSVRFVIERDGTVHTISLEPSTTLGDTSVVQCIVDVYKTLQFPKPDNGIITVVYPIGFDPG